MQFAYTTFIILYLPWVQSFPDHITTITYLYLPCNMLCVPPFLPSYRWDTPRARRNSQYMRALLFVPTGLCTEKLQRTQPADYISAHCMHVHIACMLVHDCVGVQMQHIVASHVEHCMDSIMQSTLRLECSAESAEFPFTRIYQTQSQL